MNIPQILLSGFAMSIVGGVMGMTFARIAAINESDLYPKAPTPCIAVGAVIGLAFGCGQEALRELASEAEETD